MPPALQPPSQAARTDLSPAVEACWHAFWSCTEMATGPLHAELRTTAVPNDRCLVMARQKS